jgi:hypothetical protein
MLLKPCHGQRFCPDLSPGVTSPSQEMQRASASAGAHFNLTPAEEREEPARDFTIALAFEVRTRAKR